MKRTVFISGPMTGIRHYNYPAFDEAEKKLKKLGYRVLNPASIGRKYGMEREYSFYIGEAMKMLVDADAVVFLKNWGFSQGAKIEMAAATILNKEILHLTVIKPLAKN